MKLWITSLSLSLFWDFSTVFLFVWCLGLKELEELMTSNFEQMVLRYIIPGSIFNLRLLWGPLPETLCKMVTAFGVFNGINISILSFATTATKFAFIVWFRTIPVMDDNFLAFFINLNLTLLSILATFSKMMLQPSPTTVEVHFNIFLTFSFFWFWSVFQCICAGTKPIQFSNYYGFPVASLTGLVCLFGHIILSIVICIVKKEEIPIANHQNFQSTDFAKVLNTFLVSLMLAIGAVLIWSINRFVFHLPSGNIF